MITLGPLSDIEPGQLRQWRNDPRVFQWCRQHTQLETWEHEAWLESLKTRRDVKMFGVFSLGEPVGVCGLTSIDMVNRHAEFSLYIVPGAQGDGRGQGALEALVRYGFNVLGLKHIFGETFDGNPASAMFEKVGFKKEGTRRAFYYRHGKFIDAHLYSILAEDLYA